MSLVRIICRSNVHPLLSLQSSRAMASTSPVGRTGPVEAIIVEKLQTALSPSHLQVINESHMHNVPANSETHFKVVVVSSIFEEKTSLIMRHRLINSALASELDGPIHALSILAKTPAQWEKLERTGSAEVPASPRCMGGDGSLPSRKDGN